MRMVHENDDGRHDGDPLRPPLIGTLALTTGVQTTLARFYLTGKKMHLDVSKYTGEDEQRLGIP